MNNTEMTKQAQDLNTRRADVLTRTKNVLIHRLNLSLTPEQIDDDSPLFGMGLGLDSIDSLELVVGVEEEFGIQVGDEDLEVFLSVNSLVDFILNGQKKKRGAEVDVGAVDPEDREWTADYKALRESALVYDLPLNILEIPEGDASFAFLGRVLAGKDLLLEPQKTLHTMILDDQGKILDLVYVMMFDDKFWISFTPGNDLGKKWILSQAQAEGLPVSDVGSQWGCTVAEGPYSWKLAKPLAGFEVTGLGYLHFMYAELEGENLIIFRAGTTNEYGFRVLYPAGRGAGVKNLFAAQDLEGARVSSSWENAFGCLSLGAREVRFPLLGVTVPAHASPAAYELRWMADYSKEDFIGRQALLEDVEVHSSKVMAFLIQDSQGADALWSQEAPEVVVDGQGIGKVLDLQYSPGVDQWFGYAAIQKEWAYAGNDCYSLRTSSGTSVKITTQSTPLFLTQSALVQME